jgi:hypothetical protein
MNDFDVTRNSHSSAPPPDIVLSHINLDNLQYAVMRLPSFAICNALWDTFCDSVYPIYPLIDLTSFETLKTEFWEGYNTCSNFKEVRSFASKSPGIICIFLAVLCSGAVTARQDAWADPPLATENRDSMILSLKTGARMAVNAISSTGSPTLDMAISSLLLDLVLGSQVESSDHKRYIKGMTVAARRLGLNAPNAELTLDPAAQRLYQGLWDHIRWLDAQCCIATGTGSEQPFREELIGDKHRQRPDIPDLNGDIPLLLSYARAEVADFEHRLIGHVRGTILEDLSTSAYDGSQLVRVLTVLHDIREQIGQITDREALDLVKVDVSWAQAVIDLLSLEVTAVDLVPTARRSLDDNNQDDWRK